MPHPAVLLGQPRSRLNKGSQATPARQRVRQGVPPPLVDRVVMRLVCLRRSLPPPTFKPYSRLSASRSRRRWLRPSGVCLGLPRLERWRNRPEVGRGLQGSRWRRELVENPAGDQVVTPVTSIAGVGAPVDTGVATGADVLRHLPGRVLSLLLPPASRTGFVGCWWRSSCRYTR